MPYKVVYLDEAKADVREAKTLYKKQRNGLQREFARELIKAISRLKTQPSAFAIRYQNVRIIHTKVFPYGVHFYIDEPQKTVVVIAVVHNYRNIDEV